MKSIITPSHYWDSPVILIVNWFICGYGLVSLLDITWSMTFKFWFVQNIAYVLLPVWFCMFIMWIWKHFKHKILWIVNFKCQSFSLNILQTDLLFVVLLQLERKGAPLAQLFYQFRKLFCGHEFIKCFYHCHEEKLFFSHIDYMLRLVYHSLTWVEKLRKTYRNLILVVCMRLYICHYDTH